MSISVGRKKLTSYQSGLWGDAVWVKKADTGAWGLVMMTEKRSSSTCGASARIRKKNIRNITNRKG